MKKLLLATSALISLAAVPAHAELQVTIGGFTAFQAAYYENDGALNAHSDFTSEAEVAIHADATADNGLMYGAKVLLNSSTSDTANAKETSLYLAGAWGRVEMGDAPGASELNVFAPTVGIGQINGSYDDFEGANATFAEDRGDHNFTALDTSRSTKVTYYTPKVMGFQGGVSYAPQAETIPANGNQGETVSFTDLRVKDAFELGLSYDGEYRGVGIKVGGSYNFGEATVANREDLRSWSVGSQLAYNGFRVGGGYTDNGDSLSFANGSLDHTTYWNAGVTYEKNAWGVGLSYLSGDFGRNGQGPVGLPTDGQGGDYQAYVGGATYTVAPGLTVGADVAFWDRNRPTIADTNGYVVMTDVTAAF